VSDEDQAPKAIRKSSRKRPAAAAPANTEPADEHASPSPPLFVAQLDVRWRDLDAFNHVNNSTYLTYLEEARLQWLRHVPGPWFGEHSMPVLVASELNYRLPIEWPKQLAIELRCARVGNSSLTLTHRIVDATDDTRLYCDGHVVMVWIDPASGKAVAIPGCISGTVAG
jgi:acyl-CoA thioester hydrolase